MEIDNQSEPDLISHKQSGREPSVKEKRFKCDICDKKIYSKQGLSRHITTVHDKIRAFECPHCPYKAGLSSSLKKHILTHTEEKNFRCEICDKMFTTSQKLRLHIRTVHEKIRAFPCPHCPYKATQSSHLKAHLLTHTGEKNFKCDVCDKMFTTSGSLNLHIRTVHGKIRAFPCPHCPYKASQSCSLKDHLLTHTGEKNFKCDICDKMLTTSSYLKLHIRTVHEKIKAFPCPHCPYKATQSSSLKYHLLNRHRNGI